MLRLALERAVEEFFDARPVGVMSHEAWCTARRASASSGNPGSACFHKSRNRSYLFQRTRPVARLFQQPRELEHVPRARARSPNRVGVRCQQLAVGRDRSGKVAAGFRGARETVAGREVIDKHTEANGIESEESAPGFAGGKGDGRFLRVAGGQRKLAFQSSHEPRFHIEIWFYTIVFCRSSRERASRCCLFAIAATPAKRCVTVKYSGVR